MDALLDLINQPGPIRWAVDLFVLPLATVLILLVVRSLFLRRLETEVEGEVPLDDDDVEVRRQTINLLFTLIVVAAVTMIWHFRLQDLAARPDGPLAGRDDLVDWLSGAINAIVATAILGLLIFLLNRVFGYALERLSSRQEARWGLRFQGTMLVRPSQVRRGLGIALKSIRFVAILALLYIYIPLLLSLFPATRPLADRVVPLVLAPVQGLGLNLVAYLPRFISLVVIILMVRYLLRAVHGGMSLVGKGRLRLPGFDPEWAEQTERLVKIVVILGTMMIIYPFLPGAGSEVFKGFSLFIGAMFTLGASSSVNNLISGIILTYTRSFRLEDRIDIGHAVGDVIARGLFVTRIRTIFNEVITVPNNVALSGHVVNYSAAARAGGLIVRVSAGIGYEVDWRQVHELMKSAALETDNILDDPEPEVLQTDLGDFAVSYELRAWTPDPKQLSQTLSDLRRNVLDKFHEAEVEIMTPSVTAIRNAVAAAMPGAAGAAPDPTPLRFLGLGPTDG